MENNPEGSQQMRLSNKPQFSPKHKLELQLLCTMFEDNSRDTARKDFTWNMLLT